MSDTNLSMLTIPYIKKNKMSHTQTQTHTNANKNVFILNHTKNKSKQKSKQKLKNISKYLFKWDCNYIIIQKILTRKSVIKSNVKEKIGHFKTNLAE